MDASDLKALVETLLGQIEGALKLLQTSQNLTNHQLSLESPKSAEELLSGIQNLLDSTEIALPDYEKFVGLLQDLQNAGLVAPEAVTSVMQTLQSLVVPNEEEPLPQEELPQTTPPEQTQKDAPLHTPVQEGAPKNQNTGEQTLLTVLQKLEGEGEKLLSALQNARSEPAPAQTQAQQPLQGQTGDQQNPQQNPQQNLFSEGNLQSQTPAQAPSKADAALNQTLESQIQQNQQAVAGESNGEPSAEPRIETVESSQKKSTDFIPSSSTPISQTPHTQTMETMPRWDAAGLKIEVVDARTGEVVETKTQSSYVSQERLQEFDTVRQLVSRVRYIADPGSQKISMQLTPEHLGRVDLNVTLKDGEMTVHARVDSPAAQRALENNMNLLREGLEKQGLNIEKLEVSIEQREQQSSRELAEQQQREQQEQRARSRRGARNQGQILVSVEDPLADTGRRLGYNTMEFLA
jgi:flagellar hook-length control protein FliK